MAKRKRKIKQISTTPRSNRNRSGVNRNRSAKAKQLKQGLSAPVVSNSGDVAISSDNTLKKVGNFVGKAAGIASKFLPGLGGTIAKGVADLLNDPEWWSSVEGQEVTCNEPLRIIPLGQLSAKLSGSAYFDNCKAEMARPVLAEFVSFNYNDVKTSVINIKDVTMTQYVMPQIRELMNAVPLQSATDYGAVLENNITIYAMYKYVQKLIYLTKHGETYLPNFNTARFPLLQVSNFSYLQSLESRLREHLRASVRLPHTICEYLAWRFGRIYKSNDSKKSTLIMYNPITISESITNVTTLINNLLNFASTTQEYQKAQTDMKEAFKAHDQEVDVRDDTQLHYDKKEFMLRLNMDLYSNTKLINPIDPGSTFFTNLTELNTATNPVVIDSNLDNKTVFMASTVSTIDGENVTLFPVNSAFCYRVVDTKLGQFKLLGINHDDSISIGGFSKRALQPVVYTGAAYDFSDAYQQEYLQGLDFSDVAEYNQFITDLNEQVSGAVNALIGQILLSIADQKAIDLYNVPVYIATQAVPDTDTTIATSVKDMTFSDISSLSIDMGTITETVLENEQVYAAANLLHMNRTRSESFKEAEKEVATDLANVIDKVDINVN